MHGSESPLAWAARARVTGRECTDASSVGRCWRFRRQPVDALEAADRVAVRLDLVRVVEDTIEDGIGDRGIVEGGMPGGRFQLTRHDRGFSVVTVIEDLQQISLELVGEARHGEIVEQQDIGVGQLSKERRTALQGVRLGELGSQRPSLQRTK